MFKETKYTLYSITTEVQISSDSEIRIKTAPGVSWYVFPAPLGWCLGGWVLLLKYSIYSMLLRLFKNELIVSLCLQNNVVLKNETMP